MLTVYVIEFSSGINQMFEYKVLCGQQNAKETRITRI